MVQIDLTSAGMIAIVIGFILVFAGIFSQSKGKAKVEGGGIVFIGPIPIIGATSERSLYVVIALSVIFLLFFIVVNLLGR